jgi:hypothetical protein
MCGGVRYQVDGKNVTVYFPQPNAAVPVRKHDGSVQLVTWGRRKGEEGTLPQTGWARHDSIEAGKWNQYQPKPVLIAVDGFMEKDEAGKSHWYHVTKGQFIQGCLTRNGNEHRVYVVTITPTLPEFMAVHDRWPRLVASQ